MRDYETIPEERVLENPLGAYILSLERVCDLSGEELAEKRLDAEAARTARFYATIGLPGSDSPERRSRCQSGRAILGLRDEGS